MKGGAGAGGWQLGDGGRGGGSTGGKGPLEDWLMRGGKSEGEKRAGDPIARNRWWRRVAKGWAVDWWLSAGEGLPDGGVVLEREKKGPSWCSRVGAREGL